MIAFNDRIILKKALVPEQTKSGLFIASDTKKHGEMKLNVGKVLSVGAKAARWCAVGDVLMWEQFGELFSDALGDGVVAVRVADILCKLEPHESKAWTFDRVETVEDDRKQEAVKYNIAVQCPKCQKPSFYKEFDSPIFKPFPCEYCGGDMERVPEAPSVQPNLTPTFHAK